jgi:hypothetical protein
MTTINSMGGISAASIQGMDLETALMAVQSNRANLLETQLKDQMASGQAKNDQIAKLNQALGELNKVAAQFPSDATAGHKLSDTAFKDNDYQMEKEANSAMSTAGVTPFSGGTGRMVGESWYPGGVGGGTTKGQVDGAIQQLKSQIDAQSNSQQMDMLRLQSLSNKRNEAFETMTNFIKKMQDNRSSIVGNMR